MEILIFFGVIFMILVIIIGPSIKIISEWERLAILTLGKYSGMKGPGVVIIIPGVQTVANRVDLRVQASKFQSETTLTKDGVAVTVLAVLFWRVIDPEKATLEVTNYRDVVELAAQTTLRDVIGRMTLATILSNLEELDQTLKDRIGNKVTQWGIEAQGVEIRDVSIPKELQEAMSRSAQAEREKAARVIYGEAEAEAAKKFVEASLDYASHPIALQLRAMSIMYEAVKNDQNTIIIVPSNVSESLNTVALTTAVGKSVGEVTTNISAKQTRPITPEPSVMPNLSPRY